MAPEGVWGWPAYFLPAGYPPYHLDAMLVRAKICLETLGAGLSNRAAHLLPHIVVATLSCRGDGGAIRYIQHDSALCAPRTEDSLHSRCCQAKIFSCRVAGLLGMQQASDALATQ